MSAGHGVEDPVWVHGHPHEPNPVPPSGDSAITLTLPDGSQRSLTAAELQALPYREVEGCFIVSTGHGTSGPFRFGGVALTELLTELLAAVLDVPGSWHLLDVISADGFGTRLTPADLQQASLARPILLAYVRDGQPLTRAAGLVRLIVPTETDDALRQVKWVAQLLLR